MVIVGGCCDASAAIWPNWLWPTRPRMPRATESCVVSIRAAKASPMAVAMAVLVGASTLPTTSICAGEPLGGFGEALGEVGVEFSVLGTLPGCGLIEAGDDLHAQFLAGRLDPGDHLLRHHAAVEVDHPERGRELPSMVFPKMRSNTKARPAQ